MKLARCVPEIIALSCVDGVFGFIATITNSVLKLYVIDSGIVRRLILYSKGSQMECFARKPPKVFRIMLLTKRVNRWHNNLVQEKKIT